MVWQKITNATKRLLSPECLNWIYPIELYTNGKNEFLYLHDNVYYIQTLSTERSILFTTNSELLETKYTDIDDGDNIYESCIPNGTKSIFTVFNYKGNPALVVDALNVVLFKEDGQYRLRSKTECNGKSHLKKLHATYYWDMEAYDEEFNPSTFNYSEVEVGDHNYSDYKYTNTNALSESYPLRKSGSLFGDWAVDKGVGVLNPPMTWKELSDLPDLSSRAYSECYAGLAQFEHEITTSLVTTHLYSSNTLLGVYTAQDATGEDVTRSVGWLQFSDTLDYVYIKGDTLYKEGTKWYVRGKELSTEPTVDTPATYTAKDEDNNDIVVTVSFDDYVPKNKTTIILTVNATKAGA